VLPQIVADPQAQPSKMICLPQLIRLFHPLRMQINLSPSGSHLRTIDGFIRKNYSPDGDGLDVSSHPKYIFLHPAALAMLACAGATKQAKSHEVRGAIADVASMPYLVRMRLFDFLGISPPRQITEHEEAGRFIPLQQIKNQKDLTRAIADVIPLLHASAQTADAIKYVLGELGRNVVEHAETEIGAFFCAQTYKSKSRIAIGIADSGRGILSSIRRSHHAANYRDALYLALTPGISGATSKIGGNDTNAGLGLYFTKSLASLSKNSFVLYSGDTMFKLLPSKLGPTLFSDPKTDRHKIFSDLPYWKGTVIGIDIAVEEGEAFSNLLNQIRQSYSLAGAKRARKEFFKGIVWR
jgi:hypothetical protein